MTISEVAREAGLQPSAIRYYERIGLLPSPARKSGQRRYGPSVLNCLAIIQLARQSGFTLDEIRLLFFGFHGASRASERWRELARGKLAELDARMAEIRDMRDLLLRITRNCRCETLDQCGQGTLRKKTGR
jgi:MerR family redox-sensitive transcriptional activator SoxR